MGYIDFIIKPSFDVLVEVLPAMAITLENAESNKESYRKLESKYEPLAEKNTISHENAKHLDTDDNL